MRNELPATPRNLLRLLSRLCPIRLTGLVLVGCLGWGAASLGCARVRSDGGPGGDGSTGGPWGAGGTGGTLPFPGSGGSGSKFMADAGQGEVAACEGGDACICPPFKLAVIGKPGKWGANPNGDPDTALQDWLNGSSAGTAQVDNFTERTTLTPDFLARYNVIILASLAEDSNNGPWWTFSADEAAALRAWVENGGGVISLSGYSGNPAEIVPVNQLIAFSGITYKADSVWGTCAEAQT